MAKPQSHVSKVAAMFNIETSHIPVLEDGDVVGILTPTDLLKIIEKETYDAPVENFLSKSCASIYEATPLNVASRILELSNSYALSILNADGRLSGIITDHDLFSQSNVDMKTVKSTLGVWDDEDAWTWESLRNVMTLFYNITEIELPKAPVKEVMITDVITLFRKSPINTAARLMIRNDIGQIPIVDSNDRLLGMLYNLDLLKALHR